MEDIAGKGDDTNDKAGSFPLATPEDRVGDNRRNEIRRDFADVDRAANWCSCCPWCNDVREVDDDDDSRVESDDDDRCFSSSHWKLGYGEQDTCYHQLVQGLMKKFW